MTAASEVGELEFRPGTLPGGQSGFSPRTVLWILGGGACYYLAT